MTATDGFWGIHPAEPGRIAPAAGRVAGEWVRVSLPPAALGELWLEPGVVTLPELREVHAEPLLVGELDGRPVTLIGRRPDDTLELAFEPDAAVAALTTRAAMTGRPPATARLPFPYHRIPPRARRLARDALIRLRPAGREAFPSWPIEASVELVRRIHLHARRLLEPELEPAAFWPDGKRFALCLTLDVDTEPGLVTAVEIARDQAQRGLGCCWFVVGEAYSLDQPALDALLAAGGELGLHDVRHDNRVAFLPPDAIGARLDAASDLVERLGARGFRSPSMLRSEALYDALQGRFEFDSSIPDTGLYPARNGCATVFPWVRGELIVLPATIPPDGQLLARGLDPAAVTAEWIAKAEWIRSAGGAAVHLAHPDPGFSGDPPMREAYRRFLDWAAAQDDAWLALPSAVAEHWRARERALATT